MMSKKNANSELTIFQLFEELKAEMAKLQSIESKAIELDLSPIEQQLEDLNEQLKNIERTNSNATLINELQEIKRKISNTPHSDTGISKQELHNQLENLYRNVAKRIDHSIKENSTLRIRLADKWIYILLLLISGITIHFASLYSSENSQKEFLQKNDLKYRYIEMKGKATKDDIIWLNKVFRANAMDSTIILIRETVEGFEENQKAKKGTD